MTPRPQDLANPKDKYFLRQLGDSVTPPEGGYRTPIGIFQWMPGGQNKQLGEFSYNYSGIPPFYPFVQDGKEYALYSRDYTSTRVMSLPDCRDLCGEEPDSVGYCPIDLYVPRTPVEHYDFRCEGKPYEDRVNGQFGVVVGCYWGAEHYNPIYYLDLSKITEGVFKRDDRFGSPILHRNTTLEEAIDVWNYRENNPLVKVASEITCDTRVNYNWDPDVEAEALYQVLKGLNEVGVKEFLSKALTKYQR